MDLMKEHAKKKNSSRPYKTECIYKCDCVNHIVTQERKNYGTTNKPVNGTSINHQSSINQQSIKGRFSQLYQRYVYTNQNEIKGLFY